MTTKTGLILSGELEHNEVGKHWLKFSGVLQDGQSFIWYQTNFPCLHFTPFSATEESTPVVQTNEKLFRSYYGEKLKKTSFKNYKDYIKFNNQENNCQEDGIDSSLRFLSHKQLSATVNFNSEAKEEKENCLYFFNPQTRPLDKIDLNLWKIKSLSIDIETGTINKSDIMDINNSLYSVSFYAPDFKKVLMLDSTDSVAQHKDFEIIYCSSEREIINKTIKIIHQYNPQFILGWNVINFDFQFLIKKSESLNIPFNISVGKTKIEHFTRNNGKNFYINLSGRAIIDGIPFLRMMGYQFPKWKLDFVASELIDKRKIITASNEEKIAEIENFFKNDKPMLAEYNLQDSQLVYDIFRKCQLISFFLEKTLLTGLTFDKFFRKSFFLTDFLFIPWLHRLNMTAPNPKQNLAFKEINQHSQQAVGNYHNIYSLKFENFFHYCLITFSLDPVSKNFAELEPTEAKRGPLPINFNRKYNLYKKVIKSWENHSWSYPEIKEKLMKHLIHQLEESYFNTENRFYSSAFISSVMQYKNFCIENLKKVLSQMKMKCIFTENDKVYFVKEDEQKISTIEQEQLEKNYKNFIQKLLNPYQLTCRLKTQVQFELTVAFLGKNTQQNNKLFLCGFDKNHLFHHLGNSIYYGDKIKLTEVFIKELSQCLIEKKEIKSYLKEFINQLDRDDFKAHLAYSKRITANSLKEDQNKKENQDKKPAHIIAAKILIEKQQIKKSALRKIEYIITKNGAEPLLASNSATDTEHYKKRILEPISRVMLDGTEFIDDLEDIFNDTNQLSLFGV